VRGSLNCWKIGGSNPRAERAAAHAGALNRRAQCARQERPFAADRRIVAEHHEQPPPCSTNRLSASAVVVASDVASLSPRRRPDRRASFGQPAQARRPSWNGGALLQPEHGRQIQSSSPTRLHQPEGSAPTPSGSATGRNRSRCLWAASRGRANDATDVRIGDGQRVERHRARRVRSETDPRVSTTRPSISSLTGCFVMVPGPRLSARP
jgi:hypothetical protein